jgi:hypothetical protein
MSLTDSLLRQRPSVNIPWKGSTLKEILNGYEKPVRSVQGVDGRFMFNALPQKQYRRQLGAPVRSRLSQKLSMSQDLPGGQSVTTDPLCFANQIYAKSNSLYDNGNSIVAYTPSSSTSNAGSLTQEFNALRRVRSAGMHPRSNARKYSTDTKQYLYSRRGTYAQNMTAQKCNTPLPGTCSNMTPIVKFNNSKFCVQGAVDSSDVILRKKYNTIQKAAFSYVDIYGSGTSIANALAYENAPGGVTAKSIVGYPIPRSMCRATGKC